MFEKGNATQDHIQFTNLSSWQANIIRKHSSRGDMLYFLNKSQKYEREKVATLKDVLLTCIKDPIPISTESKNCLVFSIWDDFQYLKWVYLSLKTLTTFTDLNKMDVKIVADEFIFNIAIKLFEGILPYSSFIKAPKPFCFKYNIPCLPELQKYSNIVIWDADAFVYDWSGSKTDFFQQLLNSKNKKEIILGFTSGEFNKSFIILNKILNNIDPYWFYKKECNILHIDNIANTFTVWRNSSFTLLSRNEFKTNSYRNILASCLNHWHKCDETVYHVYGYTDNLTISTLQDKGYSTVLCQDFDKWYNHRKEGFTWLHPVIVDTIELSNIKHFYRRINDLC